MPTPLVARQIVQASFPTRAAVTPGEAAGDAGVLAGTAKDEPAAEYDRATIRWRVAIERLEDQIPDTVSPRAETFVGYATGGAVVRVLRLVAQRVGGADEAGAINRRQLVRTHHVTLVGADLQG